MWHQDRVCKTVTGRQVWRQVRVCKTVTGRQVWRQVRMCRTVAGRQVWRQDDRAESSHETCALEENVPPPWKVTVATRTTWSVWLGRRGAST